MEKYPGTSQITVLFFVHQSRQNWEPKLLSSRPVSLTTKEKPTESGFPDSHEVVDWILLEIKITER